MVNSNKFGGTQTDKGQISTLKTLRNWRFERKAFVSANVKAGEVKSHTKPLLRCNHVTFVCAWCCFIREFKKLRRQLQGKLHIKIGFCVFNVGHVVQNGRSAPLLAWHERFSCKGKE